MIYYVYCFDCKQEYEQARTDIAPYCCGACRSERIGVLKEELKSEDEDNKWQHNHRIMGDYVPSIMSPY